MPISIYNSLTRKKEPFEPLHPSSVTMYTCGVTVYDDCHIGHARSLYIFEVIRRYLEYRGFKVNFVRNITDIDDKIINRANELRVDWRELVKKYIESYCGDIESLRIAKADVEPRATENIKEMITYIGELVEKGYAYTTKSGVYFNVRQFEEYGKLSGQSIDQMESGARIEPQEEKKDPLDFALWKSSKEGEPSWESPWGKGRPGWHIECSVMSQKFLKTDTLDIHAGGRDLIFPHHENEIAQAEALTGKPFAKYWIHHGLLAINGQKMSKSLGNFVTIKDFIGKYRDADLLKLFFLSAHYAHPIDYTVEKIEESKKQKNAFNDFFDKVNNWPMLEVKKRLPFDNADKKAIDALSLDFDKAMDDDFNTPQAMAALFKLIDAGSSYVSVDKEEAFRYIQSKVAMFFEIFGLTVKPRSPVSREIQDLVRERDKAKRNKDFKKADAMRETLKAKYHYLSIDTSSNITISETHET